MYLQKALPNALNTEISIKLKDEINPTPLK